MGLGAWVLAAPLVSRADDTPNPCAALKRIVSAAPQGFATLGPDDGRAVAQPYGTDASCTGSHDTYECQWSSNPGAGSVADALQAVAADIAACLPQATHDQNTPGLQHFYIGAKGARTEISATTAGDTRLKIVVSGK
ncbi:hypothetical protein D7S86_06365 [Pararobbsia silviterrae]|uniref:Uncharacterized protein n=2 Tax=Pararobbsia silviterrae TaxID=1792498 RepID=A0A494YC93_9BURK|nr:hypothetical protein [Pararobbsia silviterrae]RKP57890.1 hypothetical protein D7S86_06365 [Pararobbsia silviterrae]